MIFYKQLTCDLEILFLFQLNCKLAKNKRKENIIKRKDKNQKQTKQFN